MWYTKYGRCELLTAKRSITQLQYRAILGKAPRKWWVIKFYGVGTTDGKSNILDIINLDSLHVKLAIMEHRTAKNVLMFVRERILFRSETTASIYSDHTRELISAVMTRLANNFGYINTSTGGYCPMGNSVIESFW